MADNYGKLKKIGMQVYRKLRFHLQYWDKKIYKNQEGNNVIIEFIQSGQPGMVGRLGAVESRYISTVIKHFTPTARNKQNLQVCAGVFPLTDSSTQFFLDEYTNALSNVDIFVAWSVKGGRFLYEKFCPNSKLVNFYALEPFFFDNPWTAALKDKKVLIVHPFIDTIKKQYQNRENIFANKEILPKFKSIDYVQAIQSNAGNDTNIKYSSWKDALEHMKGEIAKKDFDVAIIGAGSYGLPLASYIKSIGKQAIHVAGVTQMLFGIKGKRWVNDPKYHFLFNEYWTYPSQKETPKGNEVVEGGSYWK